MTLFPLFITGNLHASNGTPNNGTLATVPQSNGTSGTTITEFITSKSKVVRKVVKRPGLKPFHRRKSTNGWRGEGNPVQKPVIINVRKNVALVSNHLYSNRKYRLYTYYSMGVEICALPMFCSQLI